MIIRRGPPDDCVGVERPAIACDVDDMKLIANLRPRLDGANRLQGKTIDLATFFLRLVRAFLLQPREIGLCDVAGNVLTRETGGIERMNLRIMVLTGAHQVFDVLID